VNVEQTEEKHHDWYFVERKLLNDRRPPIFFFNFLNSSVNILTDRAFSDDEN